MMACGSVAAEVVALILATAESAGNELGEE